MRKIAGLAVALLATQLQADECCLSDWYVSEQGGDWAGSVEKVKGSWEKETKWQLNRSKTFRNQKGDQYAVATLTADEEYTQGLSFWRPATVRLNGEILEPVQRGHMIYALNLKKGDNTIELKMGQLSPKDTRGRGYLLSLVELDYIYTPVAKKIADAKLAITFLGKKYTKYPAKSFLKELKSIKDEAAVEELVSSIMLIALP